MTPERWQLISRIFHQASSQPLHVRDQFVRDASGGDSDVERHVRSLLAQPAADSFLQTPVDRLASLGDSDGAALAVADLGRFGVRGLLGSGGMGEVYRAHDDALGRDVAIKILPRRFIDDSDRLARFEREARVLATLNHPNIAAIYGVEAIPPSKPGDAGRRAMVLELVEGETLAERLQRGALPPAEVIDIATQLADALEAAHEKGIVHRDLKPANVKIRPDGVAKVLDFGLSKAFGAGAVEGASATAVPGQTLEGLVLGTPAYMSPEQARGQAVDKRTDIWAFGCVLYEMLAGAPVFRGDTSSDIISAVLTTEPDWSALPASTPAHVRRVVERCLVKDTRRRLRDIADARADLQDAAIASPAAAPVHPRRRVVLPWALAGTAVVIAGWLAVRLMQQDGGGAVETGQLERLTYDTGLTTMPAISSDGRLIAYASDRGGRGDLDIWVQQPGGGPPLRLTSDPADDHSPHFSPDGSQIAIRSERAGGGVYLVPALGGPERLVVAGGRNPRFSPDGTQLAYWRGQFRGPASTHASELFTIPLAGGTPIRLAADFSVTRDPVWAPDGRSLLFLGRVHATRPVAETFDWWWAPLDGRPPVKAGMFATGLLREEISFQGDGSPAAWTADGVLFTAEGNLWMVPLSPSTGRVGGPARRLTTVTGRADAPSIGSDGAIVFSVTHSQRAVERISLDPTVSDPRPASLYADNRDTALRASATADGRTLVFDRGFDTYREIWVRDVASGRQQMVVRVTAAFPGSPTISPDGARVVYRVVGASGEEQAQGMVVELAGGVPRPLCDPCAVYGFMSDSLRVLASWNDSRILGTIDVRNGTRTELVRLDGEGRLDRPHASPDDRWLAFRHQLDARASIHLTSIRTDGPAAQANWHLVEQPTTTGRPAGWSLDSSVLYSLLDTDGFRCIWGQRIDAPSGRPIGSIFPVRHLHVQMDNGPSTSFSNPVTKEGLLYERVSRTGDLWRLVRAMAP